MSRTTPAITSRMTMVQIHSTGKSSIGGAPSSFQLAVGSFRFAVGPIGEAPAEPAPVPTWREPRPPTHHSKSGRRQRSNELKTANCQLKTDHSIYSTSSPSLERRGGPDGGRGIGGDG